jgi:hypothetical protein
MIDKNKRDSEGSEMIETGLLLSSSIYKNYNQAFVGNVIVIERVNKSCRFKNYDGKLHKINSGIRTLLKLILK